MDITELTGTERELVIVALQALWRERTNAYNTAWTVCSLSGREIPNADIFGVSEVTKALTRLDVSYTRLG
ncbi:hypothetical protein DU854_22980 [Salmonella enterica subsp. enterica]|nr:hypothetical protein [Salmonella enterica subsp. enterica serovar Typhimurium]EHP3225864.1 hypothetical protein [Salmonella enterica subsp. enterica serovar Newport]